jgi:hypothetical protein
MERSCKFVYNVFFVLTSFIDNQTNNQYKDSLYYNI